MNSRVFAERVAAYGPVDAIEQEHVLVEILQHLVLAALARTGFFRIAQFRGGTFLRVIHRISRFSEDLDFVLKSLPDRAPSPAFRWSEYLEPLRTELSNEGIIFEVLERPTIGAGKRAFFKTDSIGTIFAFDLPHGRDTQRKIRIKLEIDTHPPAGSRFETSYLGFPTATAITTQTLPSAFASKTHALLCRPYVKGRDWYDFLWYVERGTTLNLVLLRNALRQVGPWAEMKSHQEAVEATPMWVLEQLRQTIRRIDWKSAVADVERFLGPADRESLSLWNAQFFEFHLERLGRILKRRTL